MKRLLFLGVVVILLLVSCSPETSGGTPTPSRPVETFYPLVPSGNAPNRPMPREVDPTPTPAPTPKPTPRPKPVFFLSWPVIGPITSQYSAAHPAIDIAAPSGTKVRAAAAGTVIAAGWVGNGGGYQVWLDHGNGICTTYNHMSVVLVRVGQHVDRLWTIGYVGSTGNSTGPHLHFEVWNGRPWSGYRSNPFRYLR